MSKQKLPLVEVRWIDAYTIDEWRSIDDLKDEEAGKECVTVGFLLKRVPAGVYMVPTVSDDGDAAGMWFIPKPFIQKVVRIR